MSIKITKIYHLYDERINDLNNSLKEWLKKRKKGLVKI